jgi:hypothetical protein
MPSCRLPRYLTVPDLRPHESPRWVPLPLGLLDDYRLSGLSDTSRWHYVGICLLAARCGNLLRGDAEWIARRIHATEPVDLLGLYRARLLTAGYKSDNGRDGRERKGGKLVRCGENAGQAGEKEERAGKKRVTSSCNSPPALAAAPPKEEKKREENKREENSNSSSARVRARGGGGSRHHPETLRLYAGTRKNARSVRELAGYFARTGAADDDIDAWLTERVAAEEAARRRRETEAGEERRRHEATVAEIMAHGGPSDEIERALCDLLTPPGVSESAGGTGGSDDR